MLERITEQNSWDFLKSTDLPIVLYGMGDGADKMLAVFEKYGIKICDIYASDEFVRGHSFRGYKVLKYSEVCEKYDDFVSVMSFAVHDEPTMTRIRRMNREHIVLAPDLPVAGDELFTREFVQEHESEFERAFSLLADEKSRQVYLDIINFKISGKIEYLFSAQTDKDEVYSDILKLGDKERIVDLGAYDGDTIREFLAATGGKYEHITAFEPDSKNFKKLEKNTLEFPDIQRLNICAWDKADTLMFERKAGRSSRIVREGIAVEADSVDNRVTGGATFIKMDVEGGEYKALIGAKNTIVRYRPKLYVCAYHRSEDMFALPNLIDDFVKGYRFYFRHHPYIPAWESNFYAMCE